MAVRPKLVGDAEHLEPKLVLPEPAPTHVDQNDCDVCGLVGAGSFGFGCFIGVRGTWSCDDPDCLAEAKSRAAGQRNLIAAE